MLLREKVAEWLYGQDDVTDVRPVTVRLHMLEWQRAAFTKGGEERIYLIGRRFHHDYPVCYIIDDYDCVCETPQVDWYIGGYDETPLNEKSEEHPFGNHWVLVPWFIEEDPESRIDDYADEPYERMTLILREYR
jgi:hypothetical protein